MDLALIYDPSIILNMQSANGEVDKSLGLARNVAMRIRNITLYVQIHIIRSPAYDILPSVAVVPEPVFLKTDHCASNKNVKFSKVFTYIALIPTFFGKKEFLNFTEN